MRRMLFLPLLLPLLALVGVTAYGQKPCEFDITGAWKLGTSDTLYRYEPNGSLSVLMPSIEGKLFEIARADYELDNPKAPKVLTVTAVVNDSGVFPTGTSSVKISDYDEISFVVMSVSGP